MTTEECKILKDLLQRAWEDFVLQTNRSDSYIKLDAWLNVTAKGVSEVNIVKIEEALLK